MSLEVPSHFSLAFSTELLHLAQQRGSRLRNAVTLKSGMRGKAVWFPEMGKGTAKKVISRHRPTPLGDRAHQQSRALIEDYEDAELVDDLDRDKMEFDPSADYVESIGMSLGRSIDDIIITAALGTATRATGGTEVDGTLSSDVLPAGQKVAAGAAGLTLAKIISARVLFYANDVPEDEELFLVYNNKAIEDVLNDSDINDHDKNEVRILMAGAINRFMGFTWIHSERLTTDTNGDRQIIAFSRRGIGLAESSDIRTRLDERVDLSYAIQAYGNMAFGAVRRDDLRVVEVAVVE